MRLVRGVHDLVHDAAKTHYYIIEYARSWAQRYGFSDIITPLLEYDTVFLRTLGDASDIVHKEMFKLEHKGEDPQKDVIVLRPEGTAPIMRTLLTTELQQNLPQKFFYAGPMFRYDRPQKGRQRQFYQFGIEILGVKSFWAEIGSIALAFDILKGLNILDLTLEINTLGDSASRKVYHEALTKYFKDVYARLSPESQERLSKNPLRILDSKSPQDQELIRQAPLLDDFLTSSAQDYFKELLDHLTHLNFPFTVNPRLVRGLDYYSHTVFEFTTSHLGAQSTLLAGGRYDSLAQLMGHSTEIPAVGWAAGVERLILLFNSSVLQSSISFALISLSQDRDNDAFRWAQTLRSSGLILHFIPHGKTAQQFKTATKLGASYGIILGEDEYNTQTVTLKNFKTGDQQKIPQESLCDILKNLSSSR